MTIDWITLAAQMANFLVLIWLLRRFLYRPILDGIDAREVEIAGRMQEAVHAKEQALAAEHEYRDKVKGLNVAQADMTETIRKSAEEQRDVLLAEAQKRVEKEHATWKVNLDEETRKYTIRMHRAGAGALLALTRKALVDLADENLEARMARHLVQQIKPMAENLYRAAGEGAEAVVTSHDALPSQVQDDLSSELRKLLPRIGVRFETSGEQAPGLVLRIGGAQVDWTVDSYIDGLDALIERQLAKGADLKAQSDEP